MHDCTLWKNEGIQRELNRDNVRLICEDFVNNGNGEWEDEAKTRIRIMWKKPEEVREQVPILSDTFVPLPSAEYVLFARSSQFLTSRTPPSFTNHAFALRSSLFVARGRSPSLGGPIGFQRPSLHPLRGESWYHLRRIARRSSHPLRHN